MKIRGFIYKSPDNEWVLAEEPDLKSCCLGKEGQIYLHGDYTVQGTLQNGHLYDAQLIEKGSFPLSSLFLLLLFVPIIKKFIKS